jgi:hypothetical protein
MDRRTELLLVMGIFIHCNVEAASLMRTRLTSILLFVGTLILAGLGWLNFGYRIVLDKNPLSVFLAVFILALTALAVTAVRAFGRRFGHPRLALVLAVLLVSVVIWALPSIVSPCSPTIATIRASGIVTVNGVKCDQCCIDWDPYPCSLCSAEDYAAGKCLGCCYAYEDCNCTTPEPDTPTPTRAITNTPRPTHTATPTLTASPTETRTNTQTWTPTLTPTMTSSPTRTPTSTPTDTPTSTPTRTPTFTPTPTNTPTPTPTPLPPVITGRLSCDRWGANGWCVESARLILTASDPQGFSVSISGEANILSISCGASCVVNLPEGQGTAVFIVTSASGRTASGSIAWKYDASLPTASVQVAGTAGANGWLASDARIGGVGTDVVSGVDIVEVSVDGGEWQPSAILSDGVYQVQSRVVDLAGLETLSAVQTVKVDTAAPGLTIIPSGTQGGGDYFRSAVTVSIAGTDSGSGVALVEYRLDGRDWAQANGLTISVDGDHGLEGRATDNAGNVTWKAIAVHIDTIPPVAAFVMPAPGSTTPGQGVVILSGNVSDVGSGIAGVELSLDSGKNWQALQIVNGIWRYDWDTTQLPNGEYQVIARARDIAGNVQSPGSTVTVIAANQLPLIDIQERWNIWESGSLSVRENGGIPVDSVRITIRDPLGRWPDVVQEYSARNAPGNITWNRRFADGTLAPPGEYEVLAEARDIYGNEASDKGTIVIPIVATSTATMTPTVTTTPSPTPTVTAVPTQRIDEPTQAMVATAIPTAQPTPEPVVEQNETPLALWPAVGLIGFLMALASVGLADARPRALARLKETLNQILSQNKLGE